MDNKTIARTFKLLSQLMELHDENPFRTKAIANVAYKLDKLPFAISSKTAQELSEVPGIGSSTASKIQQLLTTGILPDLEKLLEITPHGVLEMLAIKGLGPKKIQVIWRSLGIETVGELYYACNENRLVEAKGFGLKTQEEIKKSIEFSIASQGWSLYATAEPIALLVYNRLSALLGSDRRISFTGDYRRKNEVLQYIDLLAESSLEELKSWVSQIPGLRLHEEEPHKERVVAEDTNGLIFRFIPSAKGDFFKNLVLSTGSPDHIRQLEMLGKDIPSRSSEEAIYRHLGLDYIEPELREGLDEVALAQTQRLPALITYQDLKGTLHNHSTYSDGVHTLAEMAQYCKDELKLEYLGICDHSKTAAYANGLSMERVKWQWQEIDTLNQQLAPFHIFKGIESDILSDGSLDYPAEILAGFDFVVASIHSNLKMDEDRATNRLIKAIENPYTTILGHPTGRLLLTRGGYPVDYAKVIDACAANGVVVEINANPLRLDLDWRWHRYAMEKGVLLSINPDAHRTSGFHDMQYGVFVARKGGVSPGKCLNTFTKEQLAAWLQKRKANIPVPAKPQTL